MKLRITLPLRAVSPLLAGSGDAGAGGAADRTAAAKFALERGPAGARWKARLELETGEPWSGHSTADADALRLLQALVVELGRPGALDLGHGRARGMGAIVLDGA